MLLVNFTSNNVFICLDELQKPWIVKKTVVNPGSASSSSVETTSKTAQDDVLVEKVDNLLRQARRIRLNEERISNSSQESKQKARSKHVVTKPSSGSVKLNKTTAGSTPTARSAFASKEQNSKQKAVVNKEQASALHFQGTSAEPAPDNVRLDISDIARERSLPSKYVKLVAMHKRLAKTISGFDSVEASCEFGKEFLLKLYNEQGKDSCEEKPFHEKRIITPYTLEVVIPRAINACQNLITYLMHKVPHEKAATPQSLYFQKLVYCRATDVLNQLEKLFKVLGSMKISKECLSSQNRNFFDTAKMFKISAPFLSYGNKSELSRHAQLINELNWTTANLFLKQEIHDVFLDILRLQNRSSEREKCLRKDTVTCLTTAYGLLAKENRCSNNPATVLYDS